MSDPKETTVLIADDEPVMRELLASILREAGFRQLVFANDGQQALNMLTARNSSIGFAFLDIAMPFLSGLEVLAAALAQRPHCFFVVVSAHSAIDNVLAALNGGARGFIVKPYTGQKIHDVLQKFVKEDPQ